MPELPEVEIHARKLRRWATGRVVERAEAEDTRILRPLGPAALRVLDGARLSTVRRLGKNLLLSLSGKNEVVGAWSHLGMTGKWLRRPEEEPTPPHSRVRLHLDDGQVLHYRDPRMFGRFLVVPGARFDELPELRTLGPDPLEQGIDVPRLHDAFRRTRRAVKLALMDQAFCPGVGNIQASEALFRAGIDPRRPASSMSLAEIERIADGVRASIVYTIDAFHRLGQDGEEDLEYVDEGGANPFQVYDHAGEPCPRCGTPIERVALSQRSSYYCPSCQH